MSTIPLLTGFTSVTLALGLTALAITEAQFQHSALKAVAEATALAVAEEAMAANQTANPRLNLGEQQLTELAARWLPLLDQRNHPKASLVSYSTDGQTIRVEICETFDSWQLPWLSGALANPKVCAAANARAIG